MFHMSLFHCLNRNPFKFHWKCACALLYFECALNVATLATSRRLGGDRVVTNTGNPDLLIQPQLPPEPGPRQTRE